MNTKAESFKEYIDSKDIDTFNIDDYEKENTTVFRSFITAAGQQLPTVLIIDNSIFMTIRVQVASQIVNENKAAIISILNEENASYRPFKLYISNKDTLLLDISVINNSDSVDGDLIYTLFSLAINYLENTYRKIMKAVWS